MSTHYEQSRTRFERFAALDGRRLPVDAVDAAQVQAARWQSASFPLSSCTDEVIAHGVVEELGEMEEAAAGSAAERDAVGDICVYAAQLLTANRMAVRCAIEAADALCGSDHVEPPSLAAAASRLSRAVGKRAQRTRGMADTEEWRRALFAALVGVLATAHRFTGVDLASAFVEVTAEVIQRSIGHPAIPAASIGI